MSNNELIDQPSGNSNSPAVAKRLEKFFFEINTMLGGTSIPVQINDIDYQTIFEQAVQTYRSMSSRSIYETFGFLTLQPTQVNYVLNERIDVVYRIYRGRGLQSSGSGVFEPFAAATVNGLLRGGGGVIGGGGDLITYDLTMQYLETLDRLFARELQFFFRPETNTLTVMSAPRGKEEVLLRLSVLKSHEELLNDKWARRWLQNYTMALAKMVLGEKYTLFSTMPGAQGGATLKGERLIQSGRDEKKELEADLLTFADNSTIPMPNMG